ncbi:MAG: hypothetical protein HC875_12005 [Anaerolineales bacterium]|nr:hypothetical protein [Anaerolineales bacterium]
MSKTPLWLICLISLFLVWTTAAPGYAANTTYYVSFSDGADSNSGLSASPGPGGPFQTIAKVNSLSLQPGDTVLFKCGDTWQGEVLRIEESGSAGSPITFGAYPAAGCANKPVISGSKAIGGWSGSGPIYSAVLSAGDFPNGLNQLFRNGQRLPFGRWPNIGETGFDNGYSTINSQPAAKQINDPELPDLDWTGAIAHIKGMRWYLLNRQVSADSGDTLTFSANNDCWAGNCAGWGYWLSNHLSTLDQDGEWYYNPATRTVYLYASSAPSNIEGSVITQNDTRSWGGILLGRDLYQSVAYVIIDNFEVKNWYRHGIASPTNFDHYELNNVIIRNNTIKDVNNVGINLATWVYDPLDGRPAGWRGGYSLQVSNNLIDGANQRGIDTYARQSLFEDNQVRNVALIENLNASGMGCDTDDSGGFCTEDGDGIRVKVGQAADTGNNNTFRYNRLERTGYNGIDVFGHTNTFENNVISEACYAKGDCGGIRTFGSGNLSSTSVYNLAIRTNLIINTIGNTDGANTTYKSLFGFGLYIDHYSKNVEITGNTVLSSTVHGVLYQNSTGQMSGNTLYANSLGTMSGGQVNLTQSPTLVQPFSGNILYSLNAYTRTLVADNKTRLAASNNNYFFNPYQNSHIYAEGAKTLAQWQAYSGLDAASKTHWFNQNPGDAPLSVIFYNQTKSSQVVNLGNKKYLDLDQNQLTGSLTLAPFTSRVLIDSGEVALAPAVLYFENAVSPAQTVTLKNITAGSLTVTSIVASAGFAQTNNCPATLNPGGSCTITISFTAGGSAPVSGTLTVNHDAGSAYTTSLFGNLPKTYLPLMKK